LAKNKKENKLDEELNKETEEIKEVVDENAEGDVNEEPASEEDNNTKDSEKKDKKDILIDELTDKYKRLLAEFDNYRKRTEKEKQTMYEIGEKGVIEKLLPVIDNFERGFMAVKPEMVEDGFVVGMDKTYKQFLTLLEGYNVSAIEAVGKEFDPNLHEAVMHVEDEEKESNVVVEEYQKGYTYKGSVIRHSMVKVAN